MRWGSPCRPPGSDAHVQMWCWTDSYAPDGYPSHRKRWFYVIQADGSPKPGDEGYIYSALIPVSEQIVTPVCTTRRILELHPLPPPPPDPAPDETPSAVSAEPPGSTGTPEPQRLPVTRTPATTQPPASPQPVMVTVDNRVTNGATQMREDTDHPAYLSQRT
ncbi:hypothetical protein AB0D99_07415 [Streptomyces sp. NPDC047971]|uniref:hypothetical protein n=1 Tax=Streptomyces sp. NPDC047971 TaxID=3154499 RepID=UPI00340B3CF6